MSLLDFRIRRSVHVALLTETHKELRKSLLDKDLSMQEVFQKFSELIVSGDKRALKIIEELMKEKREGSIKKAKFSYTKVNSEKIYELIGEESLKNQAREVDDEERD